jgi:hypothetical protein
MTISHFLGKARGSLPRLLSTTLHPFFRGGFLGVGVGLDFGMLEVANQVLTSNSNPTTSEHQKCEG